MAKVVKSAKFAGKEKHLLDVASMLEKGLGRKQICEKMQKSAKVNPATTDRLIKQAKDIVRERNEQKEAIRKATMSTDYAEAVKEAIISDTEIEAVLCKLVTGNIQVQEFIRGIPVLRDVSPMEVIQAAKAIYLKRGSNAATKVDHTITDKTIRVTYIDEE